MLTDKGTDSLDLDELAQQAEEPEESTGTETPVQTSESEEERPLHKDQRFSQVVRQKNEWRSKAQRMEEEAQEAKRKLDEVLATQRALESKMEAFNRSREEEMPEGFEDIYSDPKKLYRFNRAQAEALARAQAEKIVEEKLTSFRKEVNDRETRDRVFRETVESQLEELHEKEGLSEDVDDEIIAVATKYRVSDGSGNPNMLAAYKIWQSEKANIDNSAKQRKVASMTESRITAKPAPRIISVEDLNKYSW